MRQVAARLNVPASRAYELARQGKLPAVRIGKYVRVSEKSLIDYQAKINAASCQASSLTTCGHTFAWILLSRNVPLLYVSKQMGHAKATTTLDHYAKWLPSGQQRFVNVFDTQLEKVGTKSRSRNRKSLKNLVGRVGVEPTAR